MTSNLGVQFFSFIREILFRVQVRIIAAISEDTCGGRIIIIDRLFVYTIHLNIW